MDWEKMSREQQEQVIKAIFGEPKPIIDNGSDGITDDRFSRFENAQDAIEHS